MCAIKSIYLSSSHPVHSPVEPWLVTDSALSLRNLVGVSLPCSLWRMAWEDSGRGSGDITGLSKSEREDNYDTVLQKAVLNPMIRRKLDSWMLLLDHQYHPSPYPAREG